jgi:hypothetical protein
MSRARSDPDSVNSGFKRLSLAFLIYMSEEAVPSLGNLADTANDGLEALCKRSLNDTLHTTLVDKTYKTENVFRLQDLVAKQNSGP